MRLRSRSAAREPMTMVKLEVSRIAVLVEPYQMFVWAAASAKSAG